MYGILNYQKLRIGILRGAQKYNQLYAKRGNFFYSNTGKNRSLNVAKIATEPMTHEQILLLLFTLEQSSSKVLFKYIAKEIIRGNYQFYKNTIRQNKKSVTLFSEAINLNLLIHATKQIENYDEEEIADFCFVMKLNNTRTLRFIINHIMKKYFSLILENIKQAAVSLNKNLEENELMPNCIHRMCITEMLEIYSTCDDESHIQLIELKH